jgi:hypothetical protein
MKETIYNPTLTEMVGFWDNINFELLQRIAKIKSIRGFYNPSTIS